MSERNLDWSECKLTQDKVESLFKLFDESTTLLQQSVSSSCLDAFIENAENIIDDGHVQIENGQPNSATVQKLAAVYRQLNLNEAKPEEIRTVVQLSMLKAIKQDKIQSNHQMTPDTIGILMAYLLEKVSKFSTPFSMFDLSVGTGNLLTTVMNHLHTVTKQPIHGYGIDNDESMLAVANINTVLQHQQIDLYHQDAIDSLDIPQSDLVVSDLPVGYYPLDDNAKNYETRATKGHSYVHHLLIEQAMNYLKPGGFGVFLVPANLFQSSESKQFVGWIQQHAHLQGLINLPGELFQNKQSQKSILLLQRQGPNSKQATKVLLGEFPSFKNKTEFASFMQEIDHWVVTNLDV